MSQVIRVSHENITKSVALYAGLSGLELTNLLQISFETSEPILGFQSEVEN